MKLKDLPSEMREILCAHEALRKLGFSNDQIKPIIGNSLQHDGLQIFIELITTPVFEIHVGPLWCSPEQLNSWYHVAADLWNREASIDELDEAWTSSAIFKNFATLVRTLIDRGIMPPVFDGLEAVAKNVQMKRCSDVERKE